MLRESQIVGVGFIALLIHSFFLSICVADDHNQKACRPSSCGDIHNITYPFRLRGDPQGCGYREYELICENNHTMVKLNHGTFLVADINYENYTVRVVDPNIREGNCLVSSPLHFIDPDDYFSRFPPYYCSRASGCTRIVLMNCEQSMSSDDKYIPVIPCNTSTTITAYSSSSSSPTYDYAVVGDFLSVADIPGSCTIGVNIAVQLLKVVSEPTDLSMLDLQEDPLLGLQFSFLPYLCTRQCGRSSMLDLTENPIQCYCFGPASPLETSKGRNWVLKYITVGSLLPFTKGFLYPSTFKFGGLKEELGNCRFYSPCKISVFGGWALRIIVMTRGGIGIWCLFAYLIYKFRRRHLFFDDSIEEYLQSHENLRPIKYSYSEIKMMTRNFKDKLGQGGFGYVYKGKLRSGQVVAVKVLVLSKANGQDFINEVATIGRIHHVNVVRLVGFCVQGSKWALIYDFMPNGSLDKFVFLEREDHIPLSWATLYKIALGVGRGIEYLHQGCNMQILHFDIKPHNILLDEDFTPKVSDFGLAKLYSTDESIVSLTAARGTLGYIAPELFYKNIGGVSYKADVYSYGMLLMEMVGRRKNVNAFAEHSSQIYFPSWIYDRYDQGEDMEMGDATEDEKKCVRKMVKVALWCIQMKPVDRPSMTKALDMLEGEVELLQMPPKPTLYLEEISAQNPTEAPILSCNSMGTITLQGR